MCEKPQFPGNNKKCDDFGGRLGSHKGKMANVDYFLDLKIHVLGDISLKFLNV